MGREAKVYEEAAALWRSLYGEPVPRGADGQTILDLIMQRLPDAEYARLVSPHLRPSNITFPRPARH